MLQLRENEKLLMVVRKHWFLMAGPTILLLVLLVIPPIFITFLPLAVPKIDLHKIQLFINFGLSLYFMILALMIFLLWTLYYLSMWIITTARILDIEQHGLFSREISEIPLERVQDVTIEINGLVETMLKFGTIHVQTAGEREFFIKGVPNLYEIKDIILQYRKGLPITNQKNHEVKSLNPKL